MAFTNRQWLAWAAGAAVVSCLTSQGAAKYTNTSNPIRQGVAPGGVVDFQFDANMLDALGWSLGIHSSLEPDASGTHARFEVRDKSVLILSKGKGLAAGILEARFETYGALLFTDVMRRIPFGNLAIVVDADSTWRVVDTLRGPDQHQVIFDLSDVSVEFADAPNLRILGELSLAPAWADQLGIEYAAGAIIGALSMKVAIADYAPSDLQDTSQEHRGGVAGGNTGPDVIVGDLPNLGRWARVGDIIPYSIGTVACNIGTERLNWFANTNQHPVFGQHMFRHKEGRFEQIGMSWVRHGFFALSMDLCGPCNDPTSGTQLGVGCSDPYSASLNGSQGSLGPRSPVNASTGEFPYPWSAPPATSAIHRRLQVHVDDLDPALNPGAEYFIEIHYVTSDDAAAGNNDNNASYRRVNVTPQGNTFGITTTDQTQREKPAIRAWKDVDDTVNMTDVHIPDDGLVIVGAKATELGGGVWHYEYAIHNLNSHRSVASVNVSVTPNRLIQNIGFHDVDHHSGEPFDTTDWIGVRGPDGITWATQTHAVNENANAIRWGTLYNFRFDADAAPTVGPISLGLFRPGTPDTMEVFTIVPAPGTADCDGNDIVDSCDVDCGPAGGECDVAGCGSAADCNSNEIPDHCEPDCNDNGEPDECDIANGFEDDCDGNGTPDSCDPDFDGDANPDACDEDIDNDGVANEDDACDLSPLYIPVDAGGYTIADLNNNCVIDLSDYRAYDNCIASSGPGQTPSAAWCAPAFDIDRDTDVDIKDFSYFQRAFGEPSS